MTEERERNGFVRMEPLSAEWARDSEPAEQPITTAPNSPQDRMAEVIRRYQHGEATFTEVLAVGVETKIAPVIPTERFPKVESIS